jgi:hypothetical protein
MSVKFIGITGLIITCCAAAISSVSACERHADKTVTGSISRSVDGIPGWVNPNFDPAHPESQCVAGKIPSAYRTVAECIVMNRGIPNNN